MPAFTIEKKPDLPVILQTFAPDWTMSKDLKATMADAFALLEASSEPLYYIADMSADPKFSFTDVSVAVNEISRSANAVLKHPHMKEHIVITQSPLIKLSVKGLNSDIFGRVPARTFETLDAALDYIRSQIAEPVR